MMTMNAIVLYCTFRFEILNINPIILLYIRRAPLAIEIFRNVI